MQLAMELVCVTLDAGMSGAVALAGFFVISLEKWFWRQKHVSSDGRETTG
jgi:hypothetical protein